MLFRVRFFLLLLFALISFGTFAQEKKSALVVIDMQNIFINIWGYAKDEGNKKKLDELLTTQEMAIKSARKANIPIIFVTYGLISRTNKRLRKAARGYEKLVKFTKSTDGMFSKQNRSRERIIKYLDSQNVTTLLITGANGGACVKSSIATALFTELYDVYALNTAIADFNYSDFIYPYSNRFNFETTERITGSTFTEINSLTDANKVMGCPVDDVDQEKVNVFDSLRLGIEKLPVPALLDNDSNVTGLSNKIIIE